MECGQSNGKLPVKQVIGQANTMGVPNIHIFWANNILQPALPGMPQRAKGIFEANRDA